MKITWFVFKSRHQNQRQHVTGPTLLPEFKKLASLARLRIHRGWPERRLRSSQEPVQLSCGICKRILGQGPQNCVCPALGHVSTPCFLALWEPKQRRDTHGNLIAKLFLPLRPPDLVSSLRVSWEVYQGGQSRSVNMYLAEQPFLISGRGPSAWRLLVGGSLPYLAFSFFKNQFIVT